MRAIVIDDSRTMRLILCRILREVGFEVSEARQGREALQQLESGAAPALVTVDWNMPEMNGLEFVRAVRADARWSGVRLMMVTTETEARQLKEALDAGANEYVMKPFTKEVIKEKLGLLGLG